MNDYRLLVVDDDRSIREALRALLEDAGFTVAVAANGAEAMAKMAERPPRMVLLDLMMPVLDGFEVLDRMRADPNLAGVKVCICSAISGWAEAPHANFVLHKPVTVEDLMNLVDRVA